METANFPVLRLEDHAYVFFLALPQEGGIYVVQSTKMSGTEKGYNADEIERRPIPGGPENDETIKALWDQFIDLAKNQLNIVQQEARDMFEGHLISLNGNKFGPITKAEWTFNHPVPADVL